MSDLKAWEMLHWLGEMRDMPTVICLLWMCTCMCSSYCCTCIGLTIPYRWMEALLCTKRSREWRAPVNWVCIQPCIKAQATQHRSRCLVRQGLLCFVWLLQYAAVCFLCHNRSMTKCPCELSWAWAPATAAPTTQLGLFALNSSPLQKVGHMSTLYKSENGLHLLQA